MIKSHVTPQQTIEFLNGLLLSDPEFVNTLVNARFVCNAQIAESSVQVVPVANEHMAGFLGILNGLFGDSNGQGPIAAHYDLDGKITHFLHNPHLNDNSTPTRTS